MESDGDDKKLLSSKIKSNNTISYNQNLLNNLTIVKLSYYDALDDNTNHIVKKWAIEDLTEKKGNKLAQIFFDGLCSSIQKIIFWTVHDNIIDTTDNKKDLRNQKLQKIFGDIYYDPFNDKVFNFFSQNITPYILDKLCIYTSFSTKKLNNITFIEFN